MMKKVQIKTGKRSWDMTVTGINSRGLVLTSSTGKQYVLWAKGGQMTRLGTAPRRYTWRVTNVDQVQARLPTLSTICSNRAA